MTALGSRDIETLIERSAWSETTAAEVISL